MEEQLSKAEEKDIASDATHQTATIELDKDISEVDARYLALLSEVQEVTSILSRDNETASLALIPKEGITEDDLTELVTFVNENRGQISSSLLSITENVIETVKSMTESSKTLDRISNETTQLAEYSSTIASAGEELSATINSISQNVENTVSAAGEAKKLAESGDKVIADTLNKIEEVNRVLNAANDSLSRLMDTADQANTIIRVVNDISAKTDLLALNAAIEAARAGAAGKGFAVVAHEVGRLSEKTQDSINEIETILKNIQNDVKAVSEDLQTGTTSATSATGQVFAAKATIDNIVSQINHVDNEVSNIGAAIKEQAQAVTDIASNVSTISDGSKGVNTSVQDVSDIVDSVTKRSNSTRNLLGSYDMGPRSLLLQSQVDHLYWMHRLRRMLEGKENIQQEEFVDHTKCRLGKWYLSVDLTERNETFRNLYGLLDEPHARLHNVAANVIRLFNSGDLDEAFRRYEECLPISTKIVSILDQMLASIN